MTDDILRFWTSAYPDQHPEKSHLPLFSYDRLSKGLPEKGWVWPLGSSPCKPVKAPKHPGVGGATQARRLAGLVYPLFLCLTRRFVVVVLGGGGGLGV